MKKVLILTVIAILALGVMALATTSQVHMGGNNTVAFSGSINIHVDQWTTLASSPVEVELEDYNTEIGYPWRTVGYFHVESNGRWRIIVTSKKHFKIGSSVELTISGARIIEYYGHSFTGTSYYDFIGSGATSTAAQGTITAPSSSVYEAWQFKPPAGYYNHPYFIFTSGSGYAPGFKLELQFNQDKWMPTGDFSLPVQVWIIPQAHFSDFGF